MNDVCVCIASKWMIFLIFSFVINGSSNLCRPFELNNLDIGIGFDSLNLPFHFSLWVRSGRRNICLRRESIEWTRVIALNTKLRTSNERNVFSHRLMYLFRCDKELAIDLLFLLKIFVWELKALITFPVFLPIFPLRYVWRILYPN